ncbi:hypothetical protein [Clostridium gasigenes]|uniref:DUF86 domain-containing protein n=1 Tax=Clostridium gasigenes TaxID=94869 RepID=A0A1H0UPB0_9CLOT|nr:hypothetical protein [Clostridium gasigenes]SDP68029.1 hypothetical protein SAMN04488529_1126 [Clostridium gasigenes]
MNKERLKKLIYDLDITTSELDKSIDLVKKYSDQEELVGEFSNSLKYKYLSLFIIYEDFISMMLKENTLYEIGMSVDKAIKKLYDRNHITEEQLKFLNSARLIRNKIGHRYKQPPVEVIIEFLETNETVKLELNKFIKSCM